MHGDATRLNIGFAKFKSRIFSEFQIVGMIEIAKIVGNLEPEY